jgi:membrane protein
MVAGSEAAEVPRRQPSEDVAVAQQSGLPGPLAGLAKWHATMAARHQWYALLAEMVATIQAQQPAMLAKQAAYSLLYAVPSILIMMISLAAVVDQNTGSSISDGLQQVIASEAPAAARPILNSLVQYALVKTSASTAITAAVISLAIAIWGAAGGVGAMIHAISEVYDVPSGRSFIKSNAVNIGLTLLDGILVIAALLLLAFGQLVLSHLPVLQKEGGVLAGILSSSPLVAMVLIFLALLPLYWFGLEAPKSFRWILPGAVAATVAIGILFAVIDLILTYSNPGAAYGVAGGVLILLWTLYVLSVIVIVGAIVNAVLGKHFDRKLRAAMREQPYEATSGKRVEVSEYR